MRISKIQVELEPEVRKILNEFYRKKSFESDAEIMRALDLKHSSTVKRWREDTLIPAWVLFYVWKNAPELIRDRIIDQAIAADVCADLSEEERGLMRDFATTLRLRRLEEERFAKLNDLFTRFGAKKLDDMLTRIDEAIRQRAAHPLNPDGSDIIEAANDAVSAGKRSSETPSTPEIPEGGSQETSDTRAKRDPPKSKSKKRRG